MIPSPASTWTRDGFTSPDAPTQAVIEQTVRDGAHQRLRGFEFKGEGWYPRHRVLVTATGRTKNGASTYELRFYDEDPRPAFAALARLRVVDEV